MFRPVLLACVVLATSAARPIPVALTCERAIAATERTEHTAPGLLHAIGLVESGRLDPATGMRRPWPWTVTADGVGSYYPTKDDAIAAVEALQARGTTSIDVGCMQVNLQQHPDAFRSLEQAFDPAANVAYAGRFLISLYRRLDDWSAAAAAYHSQTPSIGAAYGKLIAAVWAGAPVPVVHGPGGGEIVLLPGGGQLRMFRFVDDDGRQRVFGVLN